MAEFDPTEVRTVQITNEARGPRYVNTVEGQLIVPAGTTSDPVAVRAGELAALPQGLRESTDTPEPTGGDLKDASNRDDAPTTFQWPDDLANAQSNDGLIARKDLLEIAKTEKVEYENDANKLTLAGLIVAKRRTAAEAGA